LLDENLCEQSFISIDRMVFLAYLLFNFLAYYNSSFIKTSFYHFFLVLLIFVLFLLLLIHHWFNDSICIIINEMLLLKLLTLHTKCHNKQLKIFLKFLSFWFILLRHFFWLSKNKILINQISDIKKNLLNELFNPRGSAF
jgi:hypothetical protein